MNANLILAKELLSPPGDTIQETIDMMGMRQNELAEIYTASFPFLFPFSSWQLAAGSKRISSSVSAAFNSDIR